MTNVMTDFPIVNCQYLSSIYSEITCIWCFCFDTLRSGLFKVWNMIFCSEALFWFQTTCTFMKFYGHHANLVHKFDTSVSHTLKGLFTNCDPWLLSSKACGSWRVSHVRQEIIIISETNSFPLCSSRFHPFNIYMHYIICQYADYVYELMALVCLPGIVWLLCHGIILLMK